MGESTVVRGQDPRTRKCSTTGPETSKAAPIGIESESIGNWIEYDLEWHSEGTAKGSPPTAPPPPPPPPPLLLRSRAERCDIETRTPFRWRKKTNNNKNRIDSIENSTAESIEMQITIGENVRANRNVCGRGGGGYEDGNVGKKNPLERNQKNN